MREANYTKQEVLDLLHVTQEELFMHGAHDYEESLEIVKMYIERLNVGSIAIDLDEVKLRLM